MLLSLHPDYVMTHRLIPVAADRTTIECTWAFAPEAVAKPGFDPGYAVDFWDITNKQDWSACESVQRGPGLAARLPRAAVARRGRGVLLRHHHGPGLPGAIRLEPGTVSTVTIFDIPVKTLAGEDSSLGAAAPGAALLVVNVASQCGLTPQYTALEKLHEQFASRGLAVVGFPCNQFGGQEPGTAEEIAEFCSTSYGVTFPMFEKIEVNGPGRHAIYDVADRGAGREAARPATSSGTSRSSWCARTAPWRPGSGPAPNPTPPRCSPPSRKTSPPITTWVVPLVFMITGSCGWSP